ncbi:DUF427 domain-containing protein [Starkeya sp. ORNL1]|uniref:DUF427 domain-containing protein n=1 Tax=Starkeya sp. ORNL1 TaxID=2709380 RepID=UPI0014647273|nr:DUF427 domain-containing protein [Starkeya sp. ORNL1]QJP12290.1 DUF427 domain-containing protein [Starkeya sp. ORNL1]
MTDPRMRIPSDDHPITIVRNGSRVIVRLADQIIADTTDALTLREAKYAPVHYIPRADVAMSLLEPSPTTSYCPYKGDATYYSVGRGPRDVAWCYEVPYPAVAEIAGRLAFYSDRVDAIEELAQEPK